MTLPFCEIHRLFKDKVCTASGCCLLTCDICFKEHVMETKHKFAVILNYLSKAFFEEWNRTLIFQIDKLVNAIQEQGYGEIFSLNLKNNKGFMHDEMKMNFAAADILINEKNILAGNLEFVSNSSSLQNLTNVEFLQDLYNLVMDSIGNNLKSIQNQFNQALQVPEETYVFRFDLLQNLGKKKKQVLSKYLFRIMKEYWCLESTENPEQSRLSERTEPEKTPRKHPHVFELDLDRTMRRQKTSPKETFPTEEREEFSDSQSQKSSGSSYFKVIIDKLQKENKNLKDWKESVEVQIEELTEKLEEMIPETKTQEEEKDLLQICSQKIRKLQNYIENQSHEMGEKSERIRVLQNENSKLAGQSLLKSEKYSQLLEKLQILQKNYKNSEEKVVQQKNNLNNLIKKENSHVEEIKELNQNITDLSVKNDILSKLKNDLALEKSQMLLELEKKNEQISALEKVYSENKQELEKMVFRVQELEKNQENEQNQNLQIQQLKKINQQLRNKIQSLQSESQSYDEILMEETIELQAQLQSKNADLEAMLKIFNEMINLVEQKSRKYYIEELKKRKNIKYIC